MLRVECLALGRLGLASSGEVTGQNFPGPVLVTAQGRQGWAGALLRSPGPGFPGARSTRTRGGITMRLVGPVLYFRGQAEDDRWRLSALVVPPEGERAPPLEPEDEAPVTAAPLASRRGWGLWRHDFAFRLGGEAGREALYAIGGEAWTVPLPPAGGGRRLAYTACNGVQ